MARVSKEQQLENAKALVLKLEEDVKAKETERALAFFDVLKRLSLDGIDLKTFAGWMIHCQKQLESPEQQKEVAALADAMFPPAGKRRRGRKPRSSDETAKQSEAALPKGTNEGPKHRQPSPKGKDAAPN